MEDRPKRITTAALVKATKTIPDGQKSIKVHAGFPGLYVVAKRGIKAIRRYWIFRVMHDGKSTDRGLGSFEHVTLTEARQMSAALMTAVRSARVAGDAGTGLPQSKRSTVPTFGRCAERAFDGNAETWTETTRKLWRSVIENYLQALIPHRVNTIDAPGVLGVLAPIYETKPAIGRKVRNVIKTTLGWAQAHGHVERNMAGESIDQGLPKTAAVAEHRAALPAADLPDVLAKLDETTAPADVKTCIRLITLTAVRSGEARGARVEEFELEGDAPVWTVPADRMKGKHGKRRAHRVPLAPQVVELVKAQIAAVGGDGLLFTTAKGGAIPNSTTIRAWHKVSTTALHGLRSSFRDWAADVAHAPRDEAEACIAHQIAQNGVEASYLHTDLFDRRRQLMATWADHVTPAK